MKIHAKDLAELKLPLAALALVALVGAAAIQYTTKGAQTAHQRLQQQQAQLREATARVQRSGDEKNVIVRHLGAYQQLASQGLIGPEQRINWLDGLRMTVQQTDLFGADYQILAQQPYPYAADLNPGKLSLQQSVMKLSFRLMHDGDLMRFFHLLEAQGVGMFSINQCVLERVNESKALAYQPYLRADCDVAWITINAEPAEKKT